MTQRSAVDALEATFAAIDRLDDPAVLTAVADRAALLARAQELDLLPSVAVPLRGLTFAVKDNIDVAGFATTAGCPAYAYTPARSAPVVVRLVEAGALPVAKTNMDQFATGLVGCRSPYGTPRNPVAPGLVPGGSSSGSAVAVARGITSFALGTDTAGSGRVPAALCGVVGVKPTRGWLSGSGVVPAVRSLDCVSVFARDINLAWNVTRTAAGFDPTDPLSRRPRPGPAFGDPVRVGVAAAPQLLAVGATTEVVASYEDTLVALEKLGVELVPFDLGTFLEAGDLLYDGPWLAERTAAVGAFIEAHLAEVEPTVAGIILGGRRFDAIDVHSARYRLAGLRQRSELLFDGFDAVCLPTVPFAPTVEEVAADPVGVNERLGRFTTFVNMLDLCGVSLPGGPAALPPLGVSLYGPAWSDASVVSLAEALATGGRVEQAPVERSERIVLAVVGAHLRGQPLEHQLTDRGARFVTTTSTATGYRLFALPGTEPPKPGLVRSEGGASIEVDLWALSPEAFGSFVAAVPAPLCIGRVQLADGSEVSGFLCEPRALEMATEITSYGGWRAFRAR